MKAVVIASMEPADLASCLTALTLWLAPEDIVVANNANRSELAEQIDLTARAHGASVVRDHDTRDGTDTVPQIHEAIRTVCRAFADEIIVKVDEDVLLVTTPERMHPRQGTFLVPNVTINNYTTKIYLDAFWPDVAALCRDHDWLWHHDDPRNGRNYGNTLLELIYNTDPVTFISFCERNAVLEEIGAAQWDEKRLMVGYDYAHRGISSMAIAFHASDYLRLFGGVHGVEEVLIGTAVATGRASYVVDHGIYCHHMHYHPGREALKANPDYAEAYKLRIIEYYRARARGEDVAPICIGVPAAA